MLALEIVAAWSRYVTLPDMATDLNATSLSEYTESPPDNRRADHSARHHGLRRSLDWSYGLLAVELKDALARVGSVLGQANCVQSLGDIALRRSDHDTARQRYEEAMLLYAQIPEPYSIGVTHYCLAQIAPDELARQRHVAAARAAWLSIGFDHLVQQSLDAEFSEPDS